MFVPTRGHAGVMGKKLMTLLEEKLHWWWDWCWDI